MSSAAGTSSIPSKIVVKYDGVTVIDTGYRGDVSYQGALNSALAALGFPAENIVGAGVGTATFTKSATSPTTAIVEVYSPLDNNVWSTTLNCPI